MMYYVKSYALGLGFVNIELPRMGYAVTGCQVNADSNAGMVIG